MGWVWSAPGARGKQTANRCSIESALGSVGMSYLLQGFELELDWVLSCGAWWKIGWFPLKSFGSETHLLKGYLLRICTCFFIKVTLLTALSHQNTQLDDRSGNKFGCGLWLWRLGSPKAWVSCCQWVSCTTSTRCRKSQRQPTRDKDRLPHNNQLVW